LSDLVQSHPVGDGWSWSHGKSSRTHVTPPATNGASAVWASDYESQMRWLDTPTRPA